VIRGSVLALVVLAACTTPAPEPALPPAPAEPPPGTTVLQVRAVSAASIETRRLSYRFIFEVEGTGELIHYGTYLGADLENRKDAAERLLDLLDAVPGPFDPQDAIRRPYVLPAIETLTLTIERRDPSEGDLWTFERADGRRARLVFGKYRP
jgi:hypothetical protein